MTVYDIRNTTKRRKQCVLTLLE